MKQATKDQLKRGAKVTAAASPAIAALLVAPAETFTTLKTLKEAGFELPAIIIFVVCIWWLRADVMKIMDGRLGDINETMKSFGEDLRIRNETSDRRYEEVNERFLKNDEKFNDLGEKIVTIETRLQASAPLPAVEEIIKLKLKIENELDNKQQ